MGAQRIIRPFSWPLRRFFDRRFEGLTQRVDAGREESAARDQELQGELRREFERVLNELPRLYQLLQADMDAANDTADLNARALARIAGSSEAILEQLAELRAAVEELASRVEGAERREEQEASQASGVP